MGMLQSPGIDLCPRQVWPTFDWCPEQWIVGPLLIQAQRQMAAQHHGLILDQAVGKGFQSERFQAGPVGWREKAQQ